MENKIYVICADCRIGEANDYYASFDIEILRNKVQDILEFKRKELEEDNEYFKELHPEDFEEYYKEDYGWKEVEENCWKDNYDCIKIIEHKLL